VFPETSGSSAQLVIVVPPGQDVTQLAATPTASVVEEIKNLDQVASVINPSIPTRRARQPALESARMQAAVSEDHRAAILTAQLTVPLADVKQDMRDQFMDIRDYPRSVMPGALCYWVFNSHRRWTMRELRLGIAPSRDGTFRTGLVRVPQRLDMSPRDG
jgi:RND superfamily putative drug exporter